MFIDANIRVKNEKTTFFSKKYQYFAIAYLLCHKIAIK